MILNKYLMPAVVIATVAACSVAQTPQGKFDQAHIGYNIVAKNARQYADLPSTDADARAVVKAVIRSTAPLVLEGSRIADLAPSEENDSRLLYLAAVVKAAEDQLRAELNRRYATATEVQ